MTTQEYFTWLMVNALWKFAWPASTTLTILILVIGAVKIERIRSRPHR